MRRAEERALRAAAKKGDEAIDEIVRQWVAWTRCWRGPQAERKTREVFEYVNQRAKNVSGYRMTTPGATIPQEWYLGIVGKREDLDRVVAMPIWEGSEDWVPAAGLLQAMRLRRLRSGLAPLGPEGVHVTRRYEGRMVLDKTGEVKLWRPT